MLGNKNKKTKTAMGGIGTAILLCALMALMPMTSLVDNTATDGVTSAEYTVQSDVFGEMPPAIEKTDFEYDPSQELLGMRDTYAKGFLTEDGRISQITSSEAMHYLHDSGAYEEIDLNIKATPTGWEVNENLFVTSFGAEVARGLEIQTNQFVDPIITGLNPMLITIDSTGTSPMVFDAPPAIGNVEVGGNVIRYPLAEGYAIDYTVETTVVKQNLLIKERPTLEIDDEYFGFTEGMIMPHGYALYLDGVALGEEITITQGELEIRNIETGEVLATIPEPIVNDRSGSEPYIGTYFIEVIGSTVVFTTAVETDWLASEDRVFPIMLDPSIKVQTARSGYCRVYSPNCYDSSYVDLYRSSYSISFWEIPWMRYDFGSSSALPSGATIDEVNWRVYTSRYGGSATATAKILEACGSQPSYQTSVVTATCSGSLSANVIRGSQTITNDRLLISSIGNSPSIGNVPWSTGWRTFELCDNNNPTGTACTATTGAHNYVINAQANGGTVGIGAYSANNNYYSMRFQNSGSLASYLEVIYPLTADSDAPTADHVPYSDLTTYVEGKRTFFTTISDLSGIDTTSTNGVKLVYRINNASTWTSVAATTIGTCSTSDSDCRFKGSTTDLSAGDYVEYYWKFQDLNSLSNGPNVGYDPAPPTTASNAATWVTSNAYWFFVDDVANAGDAMKFTYLQTDVHSGSGSGSYANYHDRQMTYYEHSDEYLFEYDTTGCGTGWSNRCFYSSSSSNTAYSNWKLQWTTTPGSGYNGMGGTRSGLNNLHQSDDGYLTINAAHGPQMNLLFLYDSSMNDWAMVGIGDSTPEIETGVLAGGTAAALSSTYKRYSWSSVSTEAYHVPLNGLDINGTFGKFEWNGTYDVSRANWFCAGTSGFYYFYRSTSSTARCSSSVTYVSSNSYTWSGVALSGSQYGSQTNTGTNTYSVSNIAPQPDTSAPTVAHDILRDSHSKARTFVFTISDAGDPPTGLNVNNTVDEGPTLHYSINNGTYTAVKLNPIGAARTDCDETACDWGASLNTLERGDYVSYYATATDVSTEGSSSNGANVYTTSTNSFEVADPTKMLIVEWRDMGYDRSYLCDYQAVFYDVTNEIEFKYDTNCDLRTDYMTVGYMDHTKTHGATMRNPGTGYIYGGNPFTTNYRITTDGTDHSFETFPLGMTPVTNAQAVITGASNGGIRGSLCDDTTNWNRYSTACNANIDIPSGFTFDYFQKTFDGDDSNDRLRIGRLGYLYFIDSGSTALERGVTSWNTNMPVLPSTNTYARPGTIAPWWHSSFYGSNYCYKDTATDCGVYVRVLPFEGKGTDVQGDLDCSNNNVDCIWDEEGSPYRVNPTTDFLSITGGDLEILPGTVIQVGQGKGISIDGTCDSVNAVGTSAKPITMEGQDGNEWKGLSFTDDCTTTDDRHVFEYVDFKNTSTAAITAGSRHGDYNAICADSSGGTRACYSNGNVGNFTMSHVTFTNVETAIRHGSGQGTGISMNDFSINGADKACINLPSSANAMIKEGTMTNCNTDGETWGGAIVNFPGSTGGMLHVENVTISNAYVNLIDTDIQHVTVSNVTATIASGAQQTGTAFSSDFGVLSEVRLYNFVADDYTSASINAEGLINMTEVDWGNADLTIAPSGSSSTANGPSGDNAIIDDLTVGDMIVYRTQPSIMNDVTAGHIDFSGNAINTDAMVITNLDSGRFGIAGCGWLVQASSIDSDRLYGSCSSSAAPNTMIFDGGTLTHTSNSDHAVYARNSKITLGGVAITSSNAGSGVYLAYGSSNAEIKLIEVSQNGNDCAGTSGATGNCDVYVSSSATTYYGGYAELSAYRVEAIGTPPTPTNVPKSGHVVSASVVDSSGSELFEVGSHITNSTGDAQVWVITGDSNGATYSNHNLRAYGPAGQNETKTTDAWYISDLSSGFTIGSTYSLMLLPAPVDLNGTNMDCAYLAAWTDADTGAGLPTNGTTPTGGVIYEFDGTPMTLSEDLTLDGCVIRLLGASLTVKATATNTPAITISNGGKLVIGTSTTAAGSLQAFTSSYPYELDIQDGTLEIDGGSIRDVAQDTATKSAILVAPGATLIVKNSGTIYGSSATSDDMATVKVTGGSASIDSSTIINTANTGTALWVEGASGSYNNIAVSNAAVGIQSYNAAPSIDGFTSTGNTVGIDAHGGMTLPTIYRSSSLENVARGWKTHEVDMSAFIGTADFLQVGANSVYGGGYATPTQSWWSSARYYMITDRWNIELTYTDANGAVVSENITSNDSEGYYPTSLDDEKSGAAGYATYAGGEGGVASWHCNYYAYSYGPTYTGSFDGYLYNLWRNWPAGPQNSPGYPADRLYPEEFGFRWGEISEDYNPREEVTHGTTGHTERCPTTDGAVSMNLLKDSLVEAITTYVLTEHLAIRTVLETALE